MMCLFYVFFQWCSYSIIFEILPPETIDLTEESEGSAEGQQEAGEEMIIDLTGESDGNDEGQQEAGAEMIVLDLTND